MKILYAGHDAAGRPEYAEQLGLEARLDVALYAPVRTAADVRTALLLARGQALSADSLGSLQRRYDEIAKVQSGAGGSRYLVYGLSTEEQQAIDRALKGGAMSAAHALRIDDIHEGQKLARGVYELGNTLLYVNGDHEVSGPHLQRLKTLKSGCAYIWYSANLFLERDDMIAVTLMGQLNGVLAEAERERRRAEEARRRSRRRPSKDWTRMALNEPPLRYLADPAEREYTEDEKVGLVGACHGAVAEVSARLSPVWEKRADRLKAATIRDQRRLVESTMDRVLEYWDLMAEFLNEVAAGDFLAAHAYKTAALSMQVATARGLPKADIVDVGVAALLQDVGLGGLGPVLAKPAPLAPAELAAVHQHPLAGAELLERSEGVSDRVPKLVRQAHERLDGSGYPIGSRGVELHELSRILAVSNAYAGMIAARPYRPPLPPYDAVVSLIMGASRGWFDKDVVRALLDVLSVCPIGVLVRLESGEVARVRAARREDCTRPVVVVLFDGSGGEIPGGEVRDLAATGGKIKEIVFEDELPAAAAGTGGQPASSA
ncbi:MAG: HD domain-containing phosphohydrolase [Gemmatimonadota bacterium]